MWLLWLLFLWRLFPCGPAKHQEAKGDGATGVDGGADFRAFPRAHLF